MPFSCKLMFAGGAMSFGGLVLAIMPRHNLSAFGFFLGGLVMVVGAARVRGVGAYSRGATAAAVSALICGFAAFGVARPTPTYVAASTLAAAFLGCAIAIAYEKVFAAWFASGIVIMLAIAGFIMFPVKDIFPVVLMVALPICIFYRDAILA